jgi:hypothetical protein
MLISESNTACFFNHPDIVHHEFSPEGHTVNEDFYLAVLRPPWDAV